MKKIIILVLVLIVIIIIAMVVFGINYFNCLAEEGKPCSTSTARESTVSGSFKPPVPGSLKYKCNFFTGKTCQ